MKDNEKILRKDTLNSYSGYYDLDFVGFYKNLNTPALRGVQLLLDFEVFVNLDFATETEHYIRLCEPMMLMPSMIRRHVCALYGRGKDLVFDEPKGAHKLPHDRAELIVADPMYGNDDLLLSPLHLERLSGFVDACNGRAGRVYVLNHVYGDEVSVFDLTAFSEYIISDLKNCLPRVFDDPLGEIMFPLPKEGETFYYGNSGSFEYSENDHAPNAVGREAVTFQTENDYIAKIYYGKHKKMDLYRAFVSTKASRAFDQILPEFPIYDSEGNFRGVMSRFVQGFCLSPLEKGVSNFKEFSKRFSFSKKDLVNACSDLVKQLIRYNAAGIQAADLNLANLMMDSSGKPFIVDMDSSQIYCIPASVTSSQAYNLAACRNGSGSFQYIRPQHSTELAALLCYQLLVGFATSPWSSEGEFFGDLSFEMQKTAPYQAYSMSTLTSELAEFFSNAFNGRLCHESELTLLKLLIQYRDSLADDEPVVPTEGMLENMMLFRTKKNFNMRTHSEKGGVTAAKKTISDLIDQVKVIPHFKTIGICSLIAIFFILVVVPFFNGMK